MVKPDCRLEVERALCGAARGIAQRHQLRLALVYLRYFALNLRQMRSRITRKIGGHLLEFARNRHG
jgi:hypothetical protein